MLFKFSSKLLLLVVVMSFIGLTACVEEPTISPVARPFSMIRVGNLSLNVNDVNVKILDIDKNVIRDNSISKNQFTDYFEVPSGSRRFIALAGGDTLYNKAIDITSYGEFSIFFIGYASTNADENTFTILSRSEGDTYFLNTPGPDSAVVRVIHASGATPTDTTAALAVTSIYTAPGSSSETVLNVKSDLAFGQIALINVPAVPNNFSFVVGTDTVSTFLANLNPGTMNYVCVTGPLNPDNIDIFLNSHAPLAVMEK